jgi:8-oxo-dGTP pyrophosphatase MutT (NUDIX family)
MAFQHHETAGGVVVDAKGRFLVLERHVLREGVLRHEIRLPKGHIDPGESAEAAALREVCEESGYCACVILADLGEAFSEFQHQGRHHRRHERYFLMRLADPEPCAPAPASSEEALFTPRWLSPEAAIAHLSYASEKDFAERARAWLCRQSAT